LLESWVSSHLNKTLPGRELVGDAEDFRNRVLHAAARMGFSRVAEALIAGAQVDAHLQGKTPLMVSTERGDDTTARLLLATFGAKKDAKDEHGATALHLAAKCGNEAVVRMLCPRYEADRYAENEGRWPALHLAAARGGSPTSGDGTQGPQGREEQRWVDNTAPSGRRRA